MLNCDKCGTATDRTKQITSKKNGETYLVYECTGGCMNGKWTYTFFPPKKSGAQSFSKPMPKEVGTDTAILAYLKRIDSNLNSLIAAVLKKDEKIDEIPF